MGKTWFTDFKSITQQIFTCSKLTTNTRTRCEICLKLTIKTPERRHWRRSGVFIANFELYHTLFYITPYITPWTGKWRLGISIKFGFKKDAGTLLFNKLELSDFLLTEIWNLGSHFYFPECIETEWNDFNFNGA